MILNVKIKKFLGVIDVCVYSLLDSDRFGDDEVQRTNFQTQMAVSMYIKLVVL